MKITILNHKAISWNKFMSRMHWATRAKLVKEIHELVWIGAMAKSEKYLKNKKVNILVIGYFKDKRRHDSDNVCDKVYVDGLKVAGIIKDDDTRYVGKVTTEAKIGQKEDKVVIWIK